MTHLLHVFSGFGVDGPQLRLGRLIGLTDAGSVQHTVVALDGDTSARMLLPAGLPMRVLTPGSSGFMRKPGVIQAVLQDTRPDILMTYGWDGLGWALENRLGAAVPHIHAEDSLSLEEMRDSDHRKNQERRAALSCGAHVVVPSKALQLTASTVWQVPGSRLHRIPNGVDTNRFARPPCLETLERLGIRPDDFVIGTVGTLAPGRGLARLLRTVSMLSVQAKVLIVGHGPERAELEAMANSFGLAGRVVFAGRLRRPELVLGRFDLFALTAETAQMPHSLMEAMAAGRPVVAPAVGDVSDMVAPGNRPFIVPPADAMAMARAMGELLCAPDLRARIGAANRARAATAFPLQAMERGYLDLFARLGLVSEEQVAA